MNRPCLKCGRLCDGTSYCRTCDPDRSRRRITPGRTGRAQTRFREQVLRRAGYQCEAIIDGQRCTATTGLEAHHLNRFASHPSYDPSQGVALCQHHHRLAETNAA